MSRRFLLAWLVAYLIDYYWDAVANHAINNVSTNGKMYVTPSPALTVGK